MDKRFFSHIKCSEDVDYSIISRESIDRRNVHRVYFKVKVEPGLSREELMGLAESLVKNTIKRERCHSITVDFGTLGNADFAPYGNWLLGGEIPIEGYDKYAFKYYFNQSGLNMKLDDVSVFED